MACKAVSDTVVQKLQLLTTFHF